MPMNTTVLHHGSPSSELRAAAPASADSESSLADKLWKCPEAEKLKQKAFSSKFIKGVSEGNLSPQFYGRYTVQDAVYLAEVASLWEKLKDHAKADIFLRVVVTTIEKSLHKKAKDSLDWWHIKHDQNSYGIQLGDAVRPYLQLVTDTFNSDTPEYMLLALYPSLKLRPYLAKKCQENQHPAKSNIYQHWIEQNKEEGEAFHILAAAVDYYHSAGRLDYHKAAKLFLKAMECEIAFLESA